MVRGMITESKIKTAIRRVAAGEKPRLELRDSGPRGAGRLVLIVRLTGNRGPTAEFYAAWQCKRGKAGQTRVRNGQLESVFRQGTQTLLDFIGEKRAQLIAQNQDHVVFAAGTMTLRGREDIHAGE
jgi:hypothetical protein